MQIGLNKQLQPHEIKSYTSIKSKIKLVKTESSVSYTKCTYICSQSIIQSLKKFFTKRSKRVECTEYHSCTVLY